MQYAKIKTFEGACKVLGLNPLKVFTKQDTADEIAYKKLKVIARALNGDWKPNWNDNNEYKYFPWFDMEVSQSNPKGFVLYCVDYFCTITCCSSRLCYKSREIANYVGKQFEKIYKEYMLIV